MLDHFCFISFAILVLICLKDFREGIIPDTLLGGLLCIGLLTNGANHWESVLLLGGLSYGLYKLFPLLSGKEGLGFGDVKLMTISGLWLTLAQIPLYLFISGLGGVMLALLWYTLKKGPRFPLGPALALALGICALGENGFSKGDVNLMMTPLSGPSLPPASGGKPDSIVVLFHGYGADGEDLLTLGEAWERILPNTLFVAPHGPTVCEQNPTGNQWFGLRDWDPSRILKDIQSITPSVNHYLDTLLKTHNLPPERLALVGFSQGALLALHVALHRPTCAGVVAYSGGFLMDPTELKMARPPVLLIHGNDDEVLPASASISAEEALKTLNVPVKLMLLPGLAHGIDERGLGAGGEFLNGVLEEKMSSAL